MGGEGLQGRIQRKETQAVGLQYILDKHKREIGSHELKLSYHTNFTKGDHIPHEQEYNTRHGVSAIADEVCREIRRVGLQYILDKRKKGKRDRVSYAKVELPHHNSAKGDHIPHEQEYNTRHGVSAIADEVCREIWR